MNKRKHKDPIPDSDDREVLAEFWDTHSIADYMDEFTVVSPKDVYVSPDLSSEIVLSLDAETSRKLKKVGRKKKVDPVALAHRWISDLVNKELKRYSIS